MHVPPLFVNEFAAGLCLVMAIRFLSDRRMSPPWRWFVGGLNVMGFLINAVLVWVIVRERIG